MNFNRINLNSTIECVPYLSEDYTILLMRVRGGYQDGSKGNDDGNYLFAKLTSSYFLFEPIVLILDFSQLEYSWGNTILKSINFFREIGRDPDEIEKSVVIICSDANTKAIRNLLGIIKNDKVLLCNNEDIAYAKADIIREKFLSH